MPGAARNEGRKVELVRSVGVQAGYTAQKNSIGLATNIG
jgi:hypothetical protein